MGEVGWSRKDAKAEADPLRDDNQKNRQRQRQKQILRDDKQQKDA